MESVPPNFKFTFKLWRDITHTKQLVFKPSYVDHFISVISSVGDKKGCLLLQFPPSLSLTSLHQVEELLAVIKQADPNNEWKLALEFRNRSWYEEDTYQLLEDYNASLVLHDLPASASPLRDNGTFIYLRFHGPNGGYRGSYEEDFLYEYAQYIKDWHQEGKEVFIYFNNTIGSAALNLIKLKEFAGK